MLGLSRTRIAAIAFLVLALLFFIPPLVSINRYNEELEGTLSRALGRDVRFQGGVRVRFLPQPGFELRNFVVVDDPRFGLEPILRAETATAYLRLTSLWRGRLEIARFRFEYPSLNLVRDAQGRWNLESLLLRASQVPTAPTTATRPQPVPRFPYIEAESGRLNFKLENEKRPYALLDADFALWRESEAQWNMRIEGHPTRTNAHLTDTGVLRAEGFFHRSGDRPLEEAPFELRIRLEDGQLGQFTSLFTGTDYGWRAGVRIDATLKGSLRELAIKADAQLNDFRRYDIGASDSFRSELHCTGTFSRGEAGAPPLHQTGRLLRNVDCTMPVRDGAVTLKGWTSLEPRPRYQWQASASKLPMQAVVRLYRRAKQGVPSDLDASGIANGTFSIQNVEPRKISMEATGNISALRITSAQQQTDLSIGDIPVSTIELTRAPSRVHGPVYRGRALLFDSPPFDIGGSKPVKAQLRMSDSEMVLQAAGQASIDRLLGVAKSLGLSQRDYKATGMADFEVIVSAPWRFAWPTIAGTAQLRDAAIGATDVSTPFQLSSATINMQPETLSLERMKGVIAGAEFSGAISLPRVCSNAPCPANFDLRFVQLSIDDLNREFNPAYRRSDWLSLPRRLIGGESQRPNLLMQWNATGRLRADRLVMKEVVASDVTAVVELTGGVAQIMDLRGEILGGRHQGSWTADFSGSRPTFKGRGVLDSAYLSRIDAALREGWSGGNLSGTYELAFSGASADDLAESANGEFSFTWKNGLLRNVLSGGQPLAFTSWTGQARLQRGTMTLVAGRMQNPEASYVTSGTVGLDRSLNLKLTGDRTQLLVTGNVTKPAVELRPLPSSALARKSASNSTDAKSQD